MKEHAGKRGGEVEREGMGTEMGNVITGVGEIRPLAWGLIPPQI